MAEIKIEKKTTIWPWVLLGLLVAGLAAYFLFFKEKNNDVIALNDGSDTTAIHNQEDYEGNAVTDYVMFMEKDTANMSLGHDYTHDALTKLASATEATAKNNDVNISEDIEKVKALADKVTQNEEASTHADDIKESAKIIANALMSIQQAKFPDLTAEINDVTSNANAIDTTDLTLDQKGTVKNFFRSAKDAIKKMNNY